MITYRFDSTLTDEPQYVTLENDTEADAFAAFLESADLYAGHSRVWNVHTLVR